MKTNMLPNMHKVKMINKDGEEFVMSLELRSDGQTNYVFLSDTNELGSSRLAKDAVYLIDKICRRLKLSGESTVFFRHIYQEQMGSMFGRFNVDWKNNTGPSYKFQMLTNIEEVLGVKRILATTEVVPLEYQAQTAHQRVAYG